MVKTTPDPVSFLPFGLGLLFLPMFEESGYHDLGEVAVVQGPEVLGLQRHSIALDGHPDRWIERERGT